MSQQVSAPKRAGPRVESLTRWWSRVVTRLEKRAAWLFLAPTLLLILVLGIYPLLYALWVSLSEFSSSTMTVGKFVGPANYIEIFRDWHFWNTLKVTASLVAIVVPVELALGLIIAMAFDVDNPWMDRLRTLLIIPMMIAPVSIGILWRLIFQSETGIAGYFVSLVTKSDVLWLANPRLALWSVALVDVWQWTPLMFLLLLAGLRGLPVDVLEAARVDGANALQTLVQVKLPIMKNVVLVAVLLRFLDAVRTYDAIYVLTRGGPASATDAYTMYTFRAAFAHFNVNTAAALSLVFLVLLSILVPVLFFRLLGMKMDA